MVLEHYGLRVVLEHYGLGVVLWYYGLAVVLRHYGLALVLEHYGLAVVLGNYGLVMVLGHYCLVMVLGFNYEKQELMLMCCRHKWSLDVRVDVKLQVWTSFCVALDLAGRMTEVVQDGHIQVGLLDISDTADILVVEGGGQLYIGQEQDTLGGGFNEFQSLRGSLVDVRVYDQFLNTTQLKIYTTCNTLDDLPDAILDFSNITEDYEISKVEVQEANVDGLCQRHESFDLIFPEVRLFEEGELLCRILGGTLTVPLNRDDNMNLFSLAAPYAEGCGDGVGDTLWLGVKGNETGQYWQDVASRATVVYSNFEQNRGLPIEEPDVCVTFKGSRDIVPFAYGNWVPRPCNLERCISCHFEQLPFVRIRGLCAKSEFDRKYFLLQVNKTVVFMGAYYSLITRPPRNNSQSGDFGVWQITRYDKPFLSATLTMKSPTHYPTGLNKWTVSNDVCGKSEITLRMTSCRDEEFSCDDGSCIRLNQQCNMEANCPDGSDEVNCRFLVLPHGYNKMTPPPRKNPSTPVNVSLHILMLSVRAFDLTGFNFVCELEVRIAWKDTRIKFHHLNDAEFLNTIHLTDEQEPWMPTVEFFGDAYTTSDVEVRRSLLVAKRATGPLLDNDENLREGE
ncbi:Very low-density lipoprotein receptor-like 1 [Homarus americanus]|uniref:Very low-density lipoprotein receptor-like 1 n=1 Tax=Homarus americanus TaxID=6706 RepID=A0A8J5MYZ0_HOMAM|nr:Very low-density lipoprotein receptor-like 1 [Homarus americanus]